MPRSDQREDSPPDPPGGIKPPEGQVEEIRKLVADTQEKLDQVSRALTSLAERVGQIQKPQR